MVQRIEQEENFEVQLRRITKVKGAPVVVDPAHLETVGVPSDGGVPIGSGDYFVVARFTFSAPLVISFSAGAINFSLSLPIGVNEGGTGATTASQARTNLGIDPI